MALAITYILPIRIYFYDKYVEPWILSDGTVLLNLIVNTEYDFVRHVYDVPDNVSVLDPFFSPEPNVVDP